MNSVLIIGDDREYIDIQAHGLFQGGIRACSLDLDDLARKNVAYNTFDLLILDIYLAATDIGAMCREICTEYDGPILALGYERDERFILQLYKEGIAEYIVKPIGMSLITAKVASWLRHVPARMIAHRYRRDGFQVDAVRRIVATPEGDRVLLSKLEYHLFELLYSNRGRVMPTDLLVDRIWGQFEEGDSRLKHLVHRLRRKIEPNPSKPTYIETAGRDGYHFTFRR
jgi:DNA-binding response OmpR family regulator